MDYGDADVYRRILIVEGVTTLNGASGGAGWDRVREADLVVCVKGDESIVTKDRQGHTRHLTLEEVADLRFLDTTEVVSA